MAKQRDKVFPERDALVAFIRAHPGKVGTREIAREFGLKNADRIELKRILRELADEGAIAKSGKKIHEAATLPPTVMNGCRSPARLADDAAMPATSAIAASPASHISFGLHFICGPPPFFLKESHFSQTICMAAKLASAF